MSLATTMGIVALSKWIDDSYPADLDPEAHLWRRVTKVEEEAGEVQTALRGLVGENPRKGATHTRGEVIRELLDTAVAALGAVEHLTDHDGSSLNRLSNHVFALTERAGVRFCPHGEALTDCGDPWCGLHHPTAMTGRGA